MTDHRGGNYRLRAAAGLLRRLSSKPPWPRRCGGGAMNSSSDDSRRRACGGAPRQRGRPSPARPAISTRPAVPGTLEAALVLSACACARRPHRLSRALARQHRSPR
jgi:hypothetical protein